VGRTTAARDGNAAVAPLDTCRPLIDAVLERFTSN
jgi:hypothetical protein